MSRLFVTTWVWGSKYPRVYVERLAAGVARHLKQEHNFIVCRPGEEDAALTEVKGCFARLRTFDPDWQYARGFKPGDRIVCLDLDMVVTGPLDALFDRPEPFVILQGVNSSNPNPFNGSVWMVRAGYRPDVWTDFSLEAASKVPFDAFPDDQAWFHHKMPDAAAYGPATGVLAFQKPGWPKGTQLPPTASLVAFPGYRDPAQFTHLDWVRAHWC